MEEKMVFTADETTENVNVSEAEMGGTAVDFQPYVEGADYASFESVCACEAQDVDSGKFPLGQVFTIAISAIYLLPFLITLLVGWGMFSNSEYFAAFFSAYPNTLGSLFGIFKGAFTFPAFLMLLSLAAAVAIIVITSMDLVKKQESASYIKYIGLAAFVLAIANFLISILKGIGSVDDLVGNIVGAINKGEIRLAFVALFVFLVPVITKFKKA